MLIITYIVGIHLFVFFLWATQGLRLQTKNNEYPRFSYMQTFIILISPGLGIPEKENKMKGIFLKCSSLFMAALMFCGSTFANVPLTRGTQIPVCLTSAINSKSKTEPFVIVNNDIKSKNGTVIVKAGTPVAVEYKATKARGVGRPGKIYMRFLSTTAVDGTRIALESQPIEVEGESKRGVALGVGLGLGLTFVWPCLFVLCKKGGQATINSNTIYSNVYVAYDVDVNE